MTANWAINEEMTCTALIASSSLTISATTTSATFDIRDFDPGTRFLFVLSAFETNANNTGGLWAIREAVTDGGATTAATIGGTIQTTTAAAGTDVQVVSLYPNNAKPFVCASYAAVDTATDVSLSAYVIGVPRGM